MVSKRQFPIWLGASVLLLGCATVLKIFEPTPTPIPPTPTIIPTPTPEPVIFPTGLYVAVVGDGEEIWELEFFEGGIFTALRNGERKVVNSGAWILEGDTIILSSDFYSCRKFGSGVYRWEYDEDELLFIKVEDECLERRKIFLSGFQLGSKDYQGFWKPSEFSSIIEIDGDKRIEHVCGVAGGYLPMRRGQVIGNRIISMGEEIYMIRVGEEIGFYYPASFIEGNVALSAPLDKLPDECEDSAIEIIAIDPDVVVEGDPVTIRVTVRYRLEGSSRGEIHLGFNVKNPRWNSIVDQIVVEPGTGEIVLEGEAEPVFWGKDTPFVAYVNISEYPHSDKWMPLSDFTLPIEVIPGE